MKSTILLIYSENDLKFTDHWFLGMPAKIRQNSASINDFLKPNSSLKTASRMWFNGCRRRLAVNTVFLAKRYCSDRKDGGQSNRLDFNTNAALWGKFKGLRVFCYAKTRFQCLKGICTRFLTSGIFYESVSPGPSCTHGGPFKFLRKFADIFESKG